VGQSVRTPQEINAEILSRLDVAAEYEALGVRLKGQPRASGMVSCYACGREDRSPSAWINIRSGCYGDSGGRDTAAYTMSLWDFAVKVGRFPDWQTARKAYASKVGVAIGREKKTAGKTDWRDKLEFQSWDTPGNDMLAQRWCMVAKPGVTPEAIRAAGGMLAYYPCWRDKKTGEKRRTRDCRQVVALPCYGPWFLEADPVAWQIFDVTGQPFDVTPKDMPPDEPPVLAKHLSVGPTSGTLMGLSSLMLLCDPDRRAGVELVWKVEGPIDMLALWASLPPEQRETVAIVTQAGGAAAEVQSHQAKPLAGLRVAVVGDCDDAGQVGTEKWCRALDGLAAELRAVRLPWDIEPKHGKDVRDFLTGAPISLEEGRNGEAENEEAEEGHRATTEAGPRR